MDQPKPQKQQRINIEIPGDLEAVYANFALISHSASEVIMDFARVLPNIPKGKVHARVLMTAYNAKLLYNALGNNLEKYEAQHGEIKVPEKQQGFDPERPMGFPHP
jgi:hypothetical protein